MAGTTKKPSAWRKGKVCHPRTSRFLRVEETHLANAANYRKAGLECLGQIV